MSVSAFETALTQSLPDGELAKAFIANGLPDRRDEGWKWSDLRRALPASYVSSTSYAGVLSASVLKLDMTGELIIANGSMLKDRVLLGAGSSMAELQTGPQVFPDLMMASLATNTPAREVTLSANVSHRLMIRRLSDGGGYHADQIRIVLDPGARALVIESHECTDTPSFANSLTQYELGEGATLTHIVLHDGSESSALVSHTEFQCAEGVRLRQFIQSRGSAFARIETAVTAAGRADIDLDGVYALAGNTHCDLTSRVNYQTSGTVARQLVKGVVADRARAVFQGKFFVDKDAQQTDARMGHHAIVLSDGASVNAKPELEIYADDVECAHGNTIGALDEDALFYLRQRGLSADAARRMMIDAFFGEVYSQIEDEELRNALMAQFGVAR